MEAIWLISYIGLWLLVLILTLTVVVMARQIGLLHSRIGATGARMANAGLKVGEKASEVKVLDLKGRELIIGRDADKPTLLVFITPTCETCSALAPALRTIWKNESDKLRIVLVSMYADDKAAEQFLIQNKLTEVTCTTSSTLGFDYNVSSTPYVILLDNEAIVRSKGMTNKLEHLESVLNTLDEGFSSMEEWLSDNRKNGFWAMPEIDLVGQKK